MHIRTKFDGGKVINRCQSGASEHRCIGAGLRQNMGREWSLHAWKDMTKFSPNQVFINAIERSAKILACSAYSRHDGGILPDQVTEDFLQSI